MRTVVVGAGVGGMVIAASLSEHADVTLLCPPGRPNSEHRWAAINEFGIEVVGAITQTVSPDAIRATMDLADIDGPDLVLLVGASTAVGHLARLLAPHLAKHSVVVVVPGRTGGAFEVNSALRNEGREARAVAETSTLPFTGRLKGPNRAFVAGVKTSVLLGAVPADAVDDVATLCQRIATFTPVGNVLESSLANVGVTMHAAGALLNAPSIERRTLDVYYRDGVTGAVARVMEAVDAERCRVAGAFRVKVPSARAYVDAAYGTASADLYEAIHGNPAYYEIGGLDDLGHRYLSEDLPASAVPLAALARVAGVETPVLDALLCLGDLVTNQSYTRSGRTLDRMGIDGLDSDELIQFAATGVRPEAGVGREKRR